MHPVFSVLVGLIMIPFVLIGLFLAMGLYIFGYLFNIISLPVKELHKLLHNEGQEVKHGTQFIIYFISWSFIFTSYALLTMFLIWLTILYSLCSIVTYIWSLGGFKFHVFPDKVDDISIEVNEKYNVIIPLLFIAIIFILLFIVPLFKTVIEVIGYGIEYVSFDFIRYAYNQAVDSTYALRLLISAIYSVCFFAPYPKNK